MFLFIKRERDTKKVRKREEPRGRGRGRVDSALNSSIFVNIDFVREHLIHH
jgi:hypothetical protein